MKTMIRVRDRDDGLADRYSVFFKDREDSYTWHKYNMSVDANMPNGVCIYMGPYTVQASRYRDEVDINTLPIGTRKQIEFIEKEFFPDV